MDNFNQLASEEIISQTASALETNGFKTIVVSTGAEAKQKALELIPEQSEVMTMTSVTLDSIGLAQEINESGRFNSVRAKFATMDPKAEAGAMRKLGAGPDYVIGSVHAISADGKVFIASATGSQLPAYAYGAGQVIWVASTKKIVADEATAHERIYQHVLPLESERAHKAYGVPGSAVRKLLSMYNENPGRITIILVKEDLGF